MTTHTQTSHEDFATTDPATGCRYYLYPNVKLGKNVRVYMNALVGFPPRGKAIGELELVIGDNAVIRPNTAIYAGNVIGNNFETRRRNGCCNRTTPSSRSPALTTGTTSTPAGRTARTSTSDTSGSAQTISRVMARPTTRFASSSVGAGPSRIRQLSVEVPPAPCSSSVQATNRSQEVQC